MRAYVTGGTGFIGSNIVKVFAERHGATVRCPLHSFVPESPQGYTTEPLDLLDADAVGASVAQFAPDVIVHSMILNDLAGIYSQRELAWRSYVEATLTLADAANRTGAKLILVSTDWVFDGTQAEADEHTPPNPVNYYGVLKALSEQAALLRADRAAVARVSAVNGVHWARAEMPRGQDPGFGYFVTTVLDAVSKGQPLRSVGGRRHQHDGHPQPGQRVRRGHVVYLSHRRRRGHLPLLWRRAGRADGTGPDGLRRVRP